MRHLITEPQDCYFAPSDADWAEMCEINAELDRIAQEREDEHEAMEQWNYVMQMGGN